MSEMLRKCEELINHYRGMELGLDTTKYIKYYFGTHAGYFLDTNTPNCTLSPIDWTYKKRKEHE